MSIKRTSVETYARCADLAAQLKVGARVWFDGEVQGYTVQARSARYLVCTKPFNARKTVLYTIIDLVENVRGTENLIFCSGFETQGKCEEAIERLEGRMANCFRTEVSYRNRVELKIIKAIH